MDEYFFNPINGRRLASQNLSLNVSFAGYLGYIFILGNEYSISFVILFEIFDVVKNRKVWTNLNYGPKNDKSYHIKFTGSHYNVINLIGKPNTHLISNN